LFCDKRLEEFLRDNKKAGTSCSGFVKSFSAGII